MTWFPPEDEVTFTEQSCEFVLGSAVNDVASQGDTVEMLIRGRPGPENDIRGAEREYASSIILSLYWRPTI